MAYNKSAWGWVAGIAFIGLIVWALNSSSSHPDNSSLQDTNTFDESTPTEAESNRSPSTFHGYTCTEDCSGHEAGYTWGEENEICDTDYDNGNSESFNEGVRAWAEENCDY